MKKITLMACLLVLVGCAGTYSQPQVSKMDDARLTKVLASQSDKAKARFQHRHPQETLEFFGISPGMTVVEALPGGGWYSKILLPYLGSEGELIGVDYDFSIWPRFGFFTEEQIEAKRTFTTDWPKQASEWRDSQSASVGAHTFGSIPNSLNNKVDAVLYIRALHNLNRFEGDGEYLTTALAETARILKSGGIVGVVQHQAPESADDKSTEGARGYLKKSQVIAAMEAAGLKFVGESAINQNPKDVPSDSDIVWRLPPTLFSSREDPELRAKLTAIGESNRMTLKFIKP